MLRALDIAVDDYSGGTLSDISVVCLLSDYGSRDRMHKTAEANGAPYSVITLDSWDNPPYAAVLFKELQAAESFANKMPLSRVVLVDARECNRMF